MFLFPAMVTIALHFFIQIYKKMQFWFIPPSWLLCPEPSGFNNNDIEIIGIKYGIWIKLDEQKDLVSFVSQWKVGVLTDVFIWAL